MNFLVDANIWSEAIRPIPNPRVMDWLKQQERHLIVDSIVLGEMRLGVLLLPRGKKRLALEDWFAGFVKRIECIAWDAPISLRWASLVANLSSQGYTLPAFDSMIAATALTHDLTVATHNTRDFKLAGVKVFDPFMA